MWKKDIYLEPTYCPVCKSYLGERNPEHIFNGHCIECKTTFWWKPWSNKPSAVLDSHKKAECGCGVCNR